MKIVFKAVDQETKLEVTPVNLPTDFTPEVGHVIDTTNGLYEVIGIAEVGLQQLSTTATGEPVTRVILYLRKAGQVY